MEERHATSCELVQIAAAASSELLSAPTELPLFLAAKVGGAEDEHDESY